VLTGRQFYIQLFIHLVSHTMRSALTNYFKDIHNNQQAKQQIHNLEERVKILLSYWPKKINFLIGRGGSMLLTALYIGYLWLSFKEPYIL